MSSPPAPSRRAAARSAPHRARRRRRRFGPLPLALAGVPLLLLGLTLSVVAARPSGAVDQTGKIELFSARLTPADTSAVAPRGRELGLLLRAAVPGQVVGLRYYRVDGDRGRHRGSLWTASGHRLRAATFGAVDAIGWQSASFSQPVRIRPGADYVISYHTNGAYHARTPGFFDRPYSNGPLTGFEGRQAVSDTTGSTFPASSAGRTNLFVDVAFVPDEPQLAPPSPQPAPPSPVPAPTPTATRSPAPTLSPTPQPTPTRPSPTPSPSTSPTVPAPPPPTPTPPPPAPLPPPAPAVGFPNAATTGVPPGAALTPTGDLKITMPGAVVDGEDIHGCVIVAADDVTIRRSKINCDSWCGIRTFWDGVDHKNLVVEDVEISCGSGVGYRPIAFSNYTARRVNVHGCEDGFHASENVVIEDSYIHDLVTGSGAHNDGIQSDGGRNITIRHNTIENRYDQTSAILMSNNTAPIRDVWVQNNLIAGGGYTLYCGTTGNGTVPNMHVTGNHFSTRFYPKAGYYGPVVWCEDTVEWSGNVWHDGPDAGKTMPR